MPGAEIEVVKDAVRKLLGTHEIRRKKWGGYVDYLYVSSCDRYRYSLATTCFFGHRVKRGFFFNHDEVEVERSFALSQTT